MRFIMLVRYCVLLKQETDMFYMWEGSYCFTMHVVRDELLCGYLTSWSPASMRTETDQHLSYLTHWWTR